MWGQCHGQSVVSPLETPFQSLHEVYFSFSHPCVTPYPMEAEIPLGMLLTLEQYSVVAEQERSFSYLFYFSCPAFLIQQIGPQMSKKFSDISDSLCSSEFGLFFQKYTMSISWGKYLRLKC